MSAEAEEDPRTARKLILVMTGFLICWMPYFIWLPTFTLMVSNITTICNMFFLNDYRQRFFKF